VITRVAEHEDMLTGGPDLRHYFEVGESALECIQEGLREAGAPPPKKILDLPCGYGRVLRYMRAAWPKAEVTAMELVPDAALFCADTFGAKPVLSRQPSWLSTGAGAEYDLLWCGSLLTHFDADDWEPALRYFRDRLNPGGVLIFTTHGDLSIDLLAVIGPRSGRRSGNGWATTAWGATRREWPRRLESRASRSLTTATTTARLD